MCSGLADCFSIVGTLITAPTLSQASASLPPSLFFSSCHALLSAPSVPCSGLTRSEERRKGPEKTERHKTRCKRGRWKVGAHRRAGAAAFSGFLVGEQASDQTRSLDGDWSVALL